MYLLVQSPLFVSDLLFKSSLKAKVKNNDFSPYQIPQISLGFKRNGDGQRHNYNLIIKVNNTTTKSILEPQIEVKLPAATLVTPSSRGELSQEGIYVHIFFPQLDINQIHPNRITQIMETANVGLIYKMDSDLHDNPSIMTADFVVTLFGKDIQPVKIKRKFSEMQEF